MKKSTYAEQLEKVLDWEQFRNIEKSCDNIVMKNEKEQNRDLLDIRRKWKIPVKVYEALRSTGGQPAKEAIDIAMQSLLLGKISQIYLEQQ